ncbi:MAG: sporulation protein YhbH, partial [Chloroflexi bacterium]|nr:sporulation protein YhbH [Chloroflexota bacterium]
MVPVVSVSRHDWSLHRKGPADQARHRERVREAIRANLPEIISEEAIITSDGSRVVKVPIRSLELPRFRYDSGKRDHVGQGSGDSKVGDVIGQRPGAQGHGKGKGAGNQPGVDYYEAEITVDELAELVFQDLALPNLRPKAVQELETEDIRFKEIHRHGIMSNLDKRRTLLENLRRNARAGRPAFGGLKTEDLRFRSWAPELRREANAVVLAMRDVSASMGEFEKYISRSFYFWMVRFLRTKYSNVRIVFITHHTEAKEVDEETFFRLGESGGTRVSSAYHLALEIIRERFNPASWNIYPFHFSDGDNWGEVDNQRCL